ncbi:hypothetical protein BC830DRAFT_1198451 [Chytriomyces sp. MP71]|nr:hypothetical protein BC830DRAFT_1198451 [Chytriomyces sp. MP71]
MYQMTFAAITSALALGGTAGRMRLFPTMVLMFLWTTLAYDVIAYWTWSYNGWLHSARNGICRWFRNPCGLRCD